MPVISLKPKRPVLTVNIGDSSHELPLTFTRRELEAVGTADDASGAMYDFMASYIGDEFELLGDDDIKALVKAWRDAREELGLLEMGESQALPRS